MDNHPHHGSANGRVGRQPIDWNAALSRHEGWLRTVVRSRVGESKAVDDVMQEVAVAVANGSRPVERDKVAPWLYRVAVRQSLMYRRSIGRRKRLQQQLADRNRSNGQWSESTDPLDWLLGEERRTAVRAALGRLPELDRQILLLKYTEDWSYQQLAEQLGVKTTTVEYRLLRARKRLRKELIAMNVTEVTP